MKNGEQVCRQNGELVECILKTEKGYMAHGLDLTNGRTFLQMREGDDGVFTAFLNKE